MLTGSVTGAAASLHVTQSAVSHLLREIDGLLQFPLFDRQQGRLSPTERAKVLFEEIQRSFIGLDLINDACDLLRETPGSIISIALVPVAAASILPRVISKYHAKIDKSFFRIDSVSNDQVIGQVSSRRADIGIALTTTEVPGVRRTVLKEFDALCLLPLSHRLAGKAVIHAGELADCDMISVPRADRLLNPVAEVFSHLGFEPRQIAECPSATAACAMVEEGLGFAILDPLASFPFRESGIWFAKLEPRICFEFCAYWPEGIQSRFDRDALIDLAIKRCHEIDTMFLNVDRQSSTKAPQ